MIIWLICSLYPIENVSSAEIFKTRILENLYCFIIQTLLIDHIRLYLIAMCIFWGNPLFCLKKTDSMSLCIDKTQVITLIKWELLKSLIIFIYLCFVIDSCNFRYRRPTIKLKNLVLWFYVSIMNILWCMKVLITNNYKITLRPSTVIWK